MASLLSLDEVMAMAIQMESKAAAFYRRASGAKTAASVRALLAGLAAMEDEHRKTFDSMRRKASESASKAPRADLAGEGGLYLAALASGLRIEGAGGAAGPLQGGEAFGQVLETAVEMEKEAVLFYIGLRDVMPAAERSWLERIIGEEKKHLATLAEELRKTKAT
jgi:rubrerythrin